MSHGAVGQPPLVKKNVITAVTAAAVTATSAVFAVPMGDAYSFVLNVTAATGTSPTLDGVFQTSIDGGTTYVDLPWRFTQRTAASVSWLNVQGALGRGEAATEQPAADTGGTLAKNCVFDPNFMKFKYTIGGTNPAFTFTLSCFIQPRGASSF